MKQFKMTPFNGVMALIAVTGILAGFGCSPADTNSEVVEAPETEYRTLTLAEYEDKVAGGWLGQAIGVLFGAPTAVMWAGEMIPFDFDDWYRMKPGVVDDALVLQYLKDEEFEKMLAARGRHKNNFDSWETYTPTQMPSQDDLYIELLFLHSHTDFPINSILWEVVERTGLKIITIILDFLSWPVSSQTKQFICNSGVIAISSIRIGLNITLLGVGRHQSLIKLRKKCCFFRGLMGRSSPTNPYNRMIYLFRSTVGSI